MPVLPSSPPDAPSVEVWACAPTLPLEPPPLNRWWLDGVLSPRLQMVALLLAAGSERAKASTSSVESEPPLTQGRTASGDLSTAARAAAAAFWCSELAKKAQVLLCWGVSIIVTVKYSLFYFNCVYCCALLPISL